MANDYNKIAGVYDKLSRVVYQKSIVNAQVFLIQLIERNNKVLLVGGGTGWILEEISKLEKENISVVYVEKSAAMIKLAKKRHYKNISVDFIEMPVEQFSSTEMFDVILTPFLFDNFLKKKIDYVFTKLNGFLKPKGFWLYADFVHNKTKNIRWQQLMLISMYTFFRLTTNIEAKELIDMRPYFKEDFTLITQQLYYKKFIQAVAYKKH